MTTRPSTRRGRGVGGVAVVVVVAGLGLGGFHRSQRVDDRQRLLPRKQALTLQAREKRLEAFVRYAARKATGEGIISPARGWTEKDGT